MARHLWNRPSGFVFQFHIPRRLFCIFGSTPLRINLGRLPAFEARWRATILAGRASVLLEADDMKRETVARSLKALADELKALKAKEAKADTEVNKLSFNVMATKDYFTPEMRDIEAVQTAPARAEKKASQSVRENLERIGKAIEQDGIAWQAERETFAHVLQSLASASNAVTTSDNNEIPLLSKAIDGYLSLKLENGVSKKHIDGLPRRFRAFIDHVGDKRINAYKASDLQSFASTLAKVPDVWTRHKKLCGMTAKQASDWNTGQRKPLACFSDGTINMSCCRFCGHLDKIVSWNRRAENDKTDL